MIILITGPHASGKTAMAKRLAALLPSKKVEILDECKTAPESFNKPITIITTQSNEDWTRRYAFRIELDSYGCHNLNIQALLECMPLPFGRGAQINIYQNRNYPAGSPSRFVVRTKGKSFCGNDVAELLIVAMVYYVSQKS